MTRPSPAAALRIRARRWLLVVAVLTGLGLWQGAQCADTPLASGHARSPVTASAAGDHATQVIDAALRPAAAQGVAGPGRTPHTPALEDCHLLPSGAVSAVGGPAETLLAGGAHSTVPPWRPPVLLARHPAATVLIQIGVSRT